MQEIWKDIPGFVGLYQVSNLGNIKSFVKSTKHQNQSHLLKQYVNNSGYRYVQLYLEKGKRKHFLVHKLVAMAFLENPNNYLCVNHKDENKLNNCVDNLEYCTYQYNNAYGTAKIRTFISKSKPVQQLTLDGVWLATYHSPATAAKLLNVSRTAIIDCCNGKKDFSFGYKWQYI